ncbi:MAG: hypothetical protein KDE51_04225 [Anaerolineales bacterium]|nr:hypothetical protein [Anaerolineales bacterium]
MSNPYETLHQLITEAFSEEELIVACFGMGIEYADLEGATRPTKIISLIKLLGRTGRLSDFVIWAKRERSLYDWPDANWDAIDWSIPIQNPKNSSDILPNNLITNDLSQVIKNTTVQGNVIGGQFNTVNINESDPNLIRSIRKLVLGILLLVSLSILFWLLWSGYTAYVASIPTSMEEGSINIAVMKFAVVGEEIHQEKGQSLANQYAFLLDNMVNELNSLTIRFRGPSANKITFSGETDVERAKDAELFANQINADVIMYGTIEVSDGNATIKPEFYLRSRLQLDDGAEIAGPFRMGQELFIKNLELGSVQQEKMIILQSRLKALISISLGLEKYIEGEEGDYEQAKSFFESALESAENGEWAHPDVIYLLLGNASLKLNELNEARSYYLQANEAYKNLYSTQTNYSRALIGLGSVAYSEAREGFANQGFAGVDLMKLDEAIGFYNEALENNDLADFPLAHVTIKGNFALGQTYLLKAIVEDELTIGTQQAQNYKNAQEALQLVTKNYSIQELSENSQTTEMAALAYANLGLIDVRRNNFQDAADNYSMSLEVMKYSNLTCLESVIRLRTDVEEKLLTVYVKLNNISSAMDWLKDSQEDQRVHCASQDRIDWYEKQLNLLTNPS